MKPSAARLLLLNGAPAYRRLAEIVAGVALGVGMVLILLGGFLHMPDRDDRVAWRTYGGEEFARADSEAPLPVPTANTVLRLTQPDYFMGGTYTIVRVAAADDTAVTLPDGLALPAPGEYYASPAMAQLIEDHPSDQLGDRFGTPIGERGDELLQGPSDRVVLVGSDWEELAKTYPTQLEDAFPASGSKFNTGLYRTVLAIGAVAVLIPIVLLISIVSQLGASERRERFATVRLIGAGRRAIAGVSGFEMLIATLVGGVLGIGVAAAIRPAASTLELDGSTSFGADLTPPALWTAGAIIAVALLGGATAWWRTFRDDVGALGSSRERAEKKVTAWRSVMLLVGLAMLIGPMIAFRFDAAASEFYNVLMLGGFAITAFGIVVAGPWLTRLASRVLNRFASTAPTVVAAGRLSRHARATFRSVAGLVVAVFIVSLFAGVVSAIEDVVTPRDTPGRLSMDAVVGEVGSPEEVHAVTAAITELEGIEGIAVAYWPTDDQGLLVMTPEDARAIGAVDVPDAPAVSLDLFEMLAGGTDIARDPVTPPVATNSIDESAPSQVFVITDGTAEAKERARTAIETSTVPGRAPLTRADFAAAGTLSFTHELETMAYLGMAVAIGISALSLTVATVAAALDRKRTFALLRLGGMPAAHVRRVIAIEASMPLGATLAASAGLGFFVAWAMIETLGNDMSMTWPDARYWWAVVASVAITAAAVVGSFGLVRRSTEVTSTRFE